MADLITRLKLSTSEFDAGINSAKQKTREFQETADNASKSVQDLGDKGARSASELLKEMGKMETAGRSASNYRRQLMQMQKQIADLTIGYRQMSAEMKASPLGQEVAAKIQELTRQASQYKDAINDVQQEIQHMASDTAAWDGMKQGIEGVSSALQAFAAAGVLGEQSSEKLIQVIARLKAIEAATNAVIKIGNMLQRNSSFMTGLSTIATRFNTRAKIANTAATTAQTTAQRVFNAVAKANPYVLIAAAIAAVILVLVRYTKKLNEATEAEKKNAEAIKKQKEEQKEYRTEVANSYGQLMSKFAQLRREWKQLKTEQQKTDWIKKNKSAFEELGISINGINSAEQTFVDNNRDVIEAFRKRAQAAALATRMTNLYSQQMDVMEQAQERYNEKKVSAYTVLPSTYAAKQSFTRDPGADTFNQGKFKLNNQGQYYFTAKGASEYNRELFKTDKILAGLDEQYKEINKKLDEAEKKLELLNKGVTVDTGTPEAPIVNEIELLKQKKQQLEEEKRYIKQGTQEWYDQLYKINEVDQQIKEMEQDAQDYTNSLNWDTSMIQKPDESVKYMVGSLTEANAKIKELQEQLDNLSPDTEEFKTVLALLDEWKQKQQDISDIINHTNPETIADKFKDIQTRANEIQFNFDIGAIDKGTAKKMMDDLNKELAGMGLKVKVGLEVDSTLGALDNGVNSINNVAEAFTNLTDRLEECKTGWQEFMVYWQAGMTILDSVAGIIETVSTLTNILTSATTANTAATNQNAAAAASDAAAQTSDAAATSTNAALHGAAAAAKGAESVASIPIVGWVLAVAAIAAIMGSIVAALSSAKGFTNGGIVGGNSYTGDRVIARLNSGELVLNQHQQENLFRMLNTGRMPVQGGGNVEFKIKGSDLVGVFSNYNNKRNKV